MRKQMIITLVALGIVFGGIFGWNLLRNYLMGQYFAHMVQPPIAVTTTKVKAGDWQPYINAVGSLHAVKGVDVSTEVPGVITEIHFESGQIIKQGEPILTINDRVEKTNLTTDQASLALAEINYKRNINLVKQRAISQSDLDRAKATLIQTQAAVDRDVALIAQKNIIAPFSGKLGIRMVNIGQYIAAGNPIVSLQALDPLYVEFYVPEQKLNQIADKQSIDITVDTYPNEFFKGKINAINSHVDPNTHNVLVQATIPNPHLKLYPGLFSSVRVLLPLKKKIISVPQTAISYSLYGNFIFVLKPQALQKGKTPSYKVFRQFVKIGEQFDDRVVILSGIKENDDIVTSGQLNLENDTPVTINNTVKL